MADFSLMVQSVMPSVVTPFVLGPAANTPSSSGGNGANGIGQQQRPLSNEECGIREVWAHNLEEEFHVIRRIVTQFPYVAMVGTIYNYIV